MILPDYPIENKEADQLKRAPLASKVAALIKNFQGKESFVIGIEGPWGAGKTSFINLILKELGNKNSVIVPFNPWNFTGQNELIVDFFSSLSSAIEGEMGKDYFEMAKSYASKLGSSVSPSVGLGPASISIGNLWKPKEKSLQEQRTEIDKKFRELTKKIVVVIDDIDRLDKNETRLIMKLVKMTANFPNTVFLLAYDRKRVADRLQEDGWPGEEYLKKIIQVSFTLPEPDRQGLNSILFQDLDETIKEVYGSDDIEGQDEKRWHGLVYAGLPNLFKTIRDIKRFISSLRLNWSIIGKEDINKIDFIGIETIRVFAPNYYSAISSNKSLFTGTESLYVGARNKDQAKQEQYQQILEEAPKENRQIIAGITKELFPQIEPNSGYGHDWQQEWRNDRRVCAEERFGFYFQLGIPEGAVSEVEIGNLITNLGSKDAFSKALLTFEKDKRTRAALSKLLDKVSSLSEEQAKILILSLWDLQGQITSSRQGMFDFNDPETQTMRLAYHSLKNAVAKEKRGEVLEGLIKQTDNLYRPTRFVATLKQENEKKNDSDEILIEDKDLTNSVNLLLERIKQAAKDGKLAKDKNFALYLYRWKEWENLEAVKSYVEELLKTREGLLNYLRGFVSRVYSTAGDYNKIDKQALVEFTDAQKLEDLVKAITEDDLKQMSTEDKEAVELYKNPKRDPW